MSRLLNVVFLILILMMFFSHVTADTAVRSIFGIQKEGPRSVLTIYFEADEKGSGPKVNVGDYYVLKVLNTGRSQLPGKPPYFVDYGFCRLEVGD